MKSKGHLYMANVMLDLIENPSGQIKFPGINNTYKIPENIKKSILRFPTYFRAGAVGPDFFPDLIMGQSIIHPKGSGQWLRYMLDELLAIAPETEQQTQAISFYAGYMMHYAGDMFTHYYINNYAKGVFPDIGEILQNLQSGSSRKIKKAMDDILIITRHVAVEKYLDDYIEEQTTKRNLANVKTMDIPVDYLRRCFGNPSIIDRLKTIYAEHGIKSDKLILEKYVQFMSDLYDPSKGNESLVDLIENNEHIDSWLKLWRDVAYDSVKDGTYDALDRYKMELGRHLITFYCDNEKDRRKYEGYLDTADNILGILDIGIDIPILSAIMDCIKEAIKQGVKSVAYPYIIDTCALISGKPKSELKDFDSAVDAVKKRFKNVEHLLRDKEIFEENKQGDFPTRLRREWGNMGTTFRVGTLNFSPFTNACKMGYLCLLGANEVNRLMNRYDPKFGNYYIEHKTSIGISKFVVSFTTSNGKFDGTNRDLILEVIGKDGELLDKYKIVGTQFLSLVGQNYRITFPTKSTIPLSKIHHFVLRVSGNDYWKGSAVSILDGSTNIQLAHWSGRVNYKDPVVLYTSGNYEYSYESVPFSAKIFKIAVQIQTSDITYAGTNDDVYFDIYANGRKLFTQKLDKDWHDDFERGDLETYEFNMAVPKTYGELDYFVLRKKGSDQWHVNSVLVYDMESEEIISDCILKCKVDSDGVKIEKGDSILPPDYDYDSLAPIQKEEEEIKINAVKVTIKTADKWFAGTDNDVYFKIIYKDSSNRECTDKRELDTSWHNDFERGDTDTFLLKLRGEIELGKLLRFELNKKGSDDWTIDRVFVQGRKGNELFPLGSYNQRRELRKEKDVITINVK